MLRSDTCPLSSQLHGLAAFSRATKCLRSARIHGAQITNNHAVVYSRQQKGTAVWVPFRRTLWLVQTEFECPALTAVLKDQ
jgi:hypothetical protein